MSGALMDPYGIPMEGWGGEEVDSPREVLMEQPEQQEENQGRMELHKLREDEASGRRLCSAVLSAVESSKRMKDGAEGLRFVHLDY